MARARARTLQLHGFAHRRCHRDKNKRDGIKENDRQTERERKGGGMREKEKRRARGQK